MTDEELPDMIKKAFKDFEVYVTHALMGLFVDKQNHTAAF